MKKLIITEIEGEGLVALLGETIEVWCMNYIYFGKLDGVNEADILLTDACVVYETGALTAPNFRDAQKLPGPRYIRLSAIESYGRRDLGVPE